MVPNLEEKDDIMAATSKTTHQFDVSAEQIQEFNERLLDANRRVGALYLDNVEKSVKSVAALQKKLGEQSKNEVVQSLVDAHANFTVELASAYTSVARAALA